MKRLSFTHGLRYSAHMNRLELRSLAPINSPAWHWQNESQRYEIRGAIYRISVELQLIGSNAAERVRNERLRMLRYKLQLHAATLAKKRAAAAELAKLEKITWRSGFEKALAQIAVEFGGKTAEQARRVA
jgi:poly-D-alanine transfer protein DltD